MGKEIATLAFKKGLLNDELWSNVKGFSFKHHFRTVAATIAYIISIVGVTTGKDIRKLF
jgi:hypothetical protein